eukprot:TRINITY_DN1100_c0_g1_i1.p1 TRINITY_DN1100_c0_g1~~TRINITY_DN1100_c0_g1_i1.p1  ORF type:complete len:101 (+),score=21.39 TRINITY_DN1100_c0_g1_i1:189-491(+)
MQKMNRIKWYESVIRYIEVNNNNMLLHIHYIGWNKKWDEKLFANDTLRIAKRNSRTRGPHRVKRARYATSPSNAYPNYKSEAPLSSKDGKKKINSNTDKH